MLERINIDNAVEKIKRTIVEKEEHIKLLQSINDQTKISEEIWHELCRTPLTSSDLTNVVQNIFPDATNFDTRPDYILFQLYGEEIWLPRFYSNCVRIDLGWYHNYTNGQYMPKEVWSHPFYAMRQKKYYEALEKHAGWRTLFNISVQQGDQYKTSTAFILWFIKYKRLMERIDKVNFEQQYEHDTKIFKSDMQEYENDKQKQHERCLKLFQDVIPKLYEFTSTVNIICTSDVKDLNMIKALERL